MDFSIKSAEGIYFPAVPGVMEGRLLSVLFQLEQSQWWPREKLARYQQRQLALLVEHAHKNIPFYRERLDAIGYRPGGEVALDTLPILTRAEVQRLGEGLLCKQLPKGHGRAFYVQTSGSTGRPVRVAKSELVQFYWTVYAIRDFLWHRFDFSKRFIGIRPESLKGDKDRVENRGWGSLIDQVFVTGDSAVMHPKVDIAEQWRWLKGQQPAYLLSLPNNLRALAHHARSRGERLPSLERLQSYGESLSDETRTLVGEVFGVPITDTYSCTELGYMALQCPEQGHYHVQGESVILEVLDENDRPCKPGETGRVVVTPLHNFATPLLRYEIGDYAEVGEPCSCGRGLPVLKRIAGRVRNMAQTPDGRQFWPSFPTENWMNIGTLRQLRLIQIELDTIEVELVADGPLGEGEEGALAAALHKSLPYPYKFLFRRVDEIPRGANHKYEDFVSRLTPPGG